MHEELKTIILFDLEATCSDDEVIPRDQMETIEIGAVAVNFLSLDIIDEFDMFIKPVRNTILTKFCTNLTSITQEDVDGAPEFPLVFNKFVNWTESYESNGRVLYCSWGNYDIKQLQRDCTYHKVEYNHFINHLNIMQEFSRVQGRKKRYGMKRALNIIGQPLYGVHHRGIDDSKNMIKLLPYILGRKYIKA